MIPIVIMERYPEYLNYLQTLSDHTKYISSKKIAEELGLGEVLVRKDLAYTDCVGRSRVGYVIGELIESLKRALCCHSQKKAAIFGCGGLGSALLSYAGFDKYGIHIVCGFEKNSSKITLSGYRPIYNVDDAVKMVKELSLDLAIICVPQAFAQDVCDIIVSSGIRHILTFASTIIKVPEGVHVRYVDLAANLALLALK